MTAFFHRIIDFLFPNGLPLESLHTMPLFALALIPICSELNHLGGQSITIPDPRFFCRMLGQGIAFGLISWCSGFSGHSSLVLGAGAIVGIVLWAVWKWGMGFMAVQDGYYADRRDYIHQAWLTAIVDRIMGVNRYSNLTPAQVKRWGFVYMTIRGAALLPLFIILGRLLNSWVMPIGLLGMLQGIIYYTSPTVRVAEYKEGGLIGFCFFLALMVKYYAP